MTLSGAQIERGFPAQAAAASQARSRCRLRCSASLPSTRIIRAESHARSLLLFALRTALRASREIGSFGVITHPVDDRARAFYAHWGFQDLPFDPRRAMIVRMIDLERSGVGP